MKKTVLCGNKLDRESDRQVSSDEAEAFAHEMQLHLFETSAKTGENIEDVFREIGEYFGMELTQKNTYVCIKSGRHGLAFNPRPCRVFGILKT